MRSFLNKLPSTFAKNILYFSSIKLREKRGGGQIRNMPDVTHVTHNTQITRNQATKHKRLSPGAGRACARGAGPGGRARAGAWASLGHSDVYTSQIYLCPGPGRAALDVRGAGAGGASWARSRSSGAMPCEAAILSSVGGGGTFRGASVRSESSGAKPERGATIQGS